MLADIHGLKPVAFMGCFQDNSAASLYYHDGCLLLHLEDRRLTIYLGTVNHVQKYLAMCLGSVLIPYGCIR